MSINARVAYPTDDDEPIDEGAKDTAITVERAADGSIHLWLYEVGTVVLLDGKNASELRSALA